MKQDRAQLIQGELLAKMMQQGNGVIVPPKSLAESLQAPDNLPDEVIVHTHTYKKYHAQVKRGSDELSHEIEIERTKWDDTFYIRVWAPDGCMAYDGYWTGKVDSTMDDAIAEALVGSGIENE